jgi:hypothetical protein
MKPNQSTVDRNTATNSGDGILNDGTVTLDDSTVRNNRPDNCTGNIPGCTT